MLEVDLIPTLLPEEKGLKSLSFGEGFRVRSQKEIRNTNITK